MFLIADDECLSFSIIVAIKKRGRESVASPLLFSRKQHDMSITADTVRKIGAKKSRLNKVRHCSSES